MKRLEILEKTKEYFNQELRETRELLEKKPDWLTDKDKFLDNTIHRCLGAATLVQKLGVDFEEVDPYYNETRRAIERMREQS